MSTVWRSRVAAAAVALSLVLGPLVALASVALGEPSVDRRPTEPPASFRIPAATRQVVVGVADGWGARDVVLQRHVRIADGSWSAVGDSWRGRLGARGLAWGRGLHPLPDRDYVKIEDDLRSPAGVFRLTEAYGYDPAWAQRTRMPYTKVTSRDLFIDDPTSPLYNSHIRLARDAITAWERSSRMHTVDPAHRLRVFVAHNREPVVPGGGSAIFLHIWRRGGLADTAGCTAMADADIERLVRWLDPAEQPLYVLLPRAEYAARQLEWDLPTMPGILPPITTTTTSTTTTTLEIRPEDWPDAYVPTP